MARTIIISFEEGITSRQWDEIYNEIYDLVTEAFPGTKVTGGLLTIDGSHI